MAQQTKTQKASRIKILLVVGLTVVFAAVIFPSQSGKQEHHAEDPGSAGAATRMDSVWAMKPEHDRADLLPQIDLDRLIDHNPFTNRPDLQFEFAEQHAGESHVQSAYDPAEFAQTDIEMSEASAVATAAGEANAAELQPPGVIIQAIITGGERAAALIDGRLYFEDDLFDEQWRITRIYANRMVMQPVERE